MEQDRPISFFSFPGTAAAAVNFYVQLFPNSELIELTYFGDEQPELTGKVYNASFTLMGQSFYALDFTPKEAPPASWQTSQFIEFSDTHLFDRIFTTLASSGHVLMGPEPIAQFDKAAWITDQFGITWQLVHRAA
ncbi:VOC family protein [Loigolactobacillus binensis]|uniref:VOC family protein n=1 Tax=Loigolactobacillus binensis TaxID=2559922 RepID=A0ABW3EBS8_9LACO|nr:VOC family protein [Loigolactobacillus binensis]